MGFNTTIIVLNDALYSISQDKEFGAKLAQAINTFDLGGLQSISSGSNCNAATVIETHHADGIALIAVGGNCGRNLGCHGGYRATDEDLLRSLADKLGFRLLRKPKPKMVDRFANPHTEQLE